MKRLVITLLKILVSVAIIGYLVYRAIPAAGTEQGNVFENLWNQQKNWWWLAAAYATCTAAGLITFVRWWYLVCALGIPCRFIDGIRISFWGYLLNFAPLGIVSGDLVKALMLDHEHPKHRAKAIASVLVDRVIGLYVLFLFVTVVSLATGFYSRHFADVFLRTTCEVMFAIAGGSTIGLAVLMAPERRIGWLIRFFGRIPKVGPPLESLVNAVRMYRHEPAVLGLASFATIFVHGFYAIGVYFIACGLPGNHLSLADHLVAMPTSAATQVIPVFAGPLEWMLDQFYRHVPVAGPAILLGQGLVVALAYRLVMLLVTIVGLPFYFRGRREVAEVMHEAEKPEIPKSPTP
jgi:glycosyltransferase 2 family protein